MFSTYVGFIGDQIFLPSTDSTYSCVPGDKGGQFFFRRKNFFWHSFYIQIGVLQIVLRVRFYAKSSDFYAKLNVSKIVCNKFVLVLVQIDLIQFEFKNESLVDCFALN